MLMFTLAISCLTISNMPCFMDITLQVPMQDFSLKHWTLLLSPALSTTGWIFCFRSIPSLFLELFFHWSPVAYWALLTRGVHFSMSYISALSFCSWDSQGKNTEVVCQSLLQWRKFCQSSQQWPNYLGWPQRAWLSSIRLDNAVVHVILLASCLWFWSQSVCPLMPSHRA